MAHVLEYLEYEVYGAVGLFDQVVCLFSRRRFPFPVSPIL